MKSCRPQALMHIKTVIFLGNFFHLICVLLLICQQRFYFVHKTRFLTFFILVVNVFYIYVWNGLPFKLRSLSRHFSISFYSLLKTYPFARAWAGSASE